MLSKSGATGPNFYNTKENGIFTTLPNCISFGYKVYEKFREFSYIHYYVAKWAGGHKLSSKHGSHHITLKKFYKI